MCVCVRVSVGVWDRAGTHTPSGGRPRSQSSDFRRPWALSLFCDYYYACGQSVAVACEYGCAWVILHADVSMCMCVCVRMQGDEWRLCRSCMRTAT